MIRKAFAGPLVLNIDYDFVGATATVSSGAADAIGFGRLFFSNLDLVRRFREGLPLAVDEVATWYTQGTEDYLDYPTAE
ncbi:hypothetical protein [Terrarubrum flagellatum]|uniref:hypothetical protein n=1 Tax=Terrirubrum flagellatum TaxID=2895980 RepID=UPI003145679F